MKKRTGRGAVVSTILGVAAGLVLGGVLQAAAADQVIKLRYQGKWEGHENQNWAAEQLKFAERVKAATGGKVVIENLANEVMRDSEVLDGVRRGVIDMGNQPIHIRGELNLLNFVSLPFVTLAKTPEMYNKLKPTFAAFWDKQGVQQMGYNYYLPQALYTKKPCQTMDELKGLKIRMQGNILMQLYKLAGASPMALNNADVYQAGQRGILDGAQGATAAYLSNAWYEVFKYMGYWPLGTAAMAVVMNKGSWGKLSPELQKQVMSAWSDTEKAQSEGVWKDVKTIEGQLAQKGGVILMNPAKTETDKMNPHLGPIVTEWKSKVGADGETVMKVVNEVMGTKF